MRVYAAQSFGLRECACIRIGAVLCVGQGKNNENRVINNAITTDMYLGARYLLLRSFYKKM